MSSFTSIKKLIVLILLAAMLISGCSKSQEKKQEILLCDISAFNLTATNEAEQMDQLYQYIINNSEVDRVSDQDVEKMADAIEAFYVKVVETSLEDYRSKGHEATFEEMLYFLFGLSSREALRFFSESYARDEVKSRMIIAKLAEDNSIQVSDSEYEELKGQVEVSSYLTDDKDTEIRYEILRRKVLRALLEKVK